MKTVLKAAAGLLLVAVAQSSVAQPSLQEKGRCAFPDSSTGSAPTWLCSDYEREDVSYTAVVQRKRLPSVSLQSRLAGREAMAAVVSQLLAVAAEELRAELGLQLYLHLPEADNIERLARFKGVRIFEKVKSPRRALYVLAGVERENVPALLSQARREVIAENRAALSETLGEQAVMELSR